MQGDLRAVSPVRARGSREMRHGTGRLEFARGPYGKHTYMVDFDADGRLLSWEQVLTENNFFQVQIGETKEAVVIDGLGRRSGPTRRGDVHVPAGTLVPVLRFDDV